MQLFSSITELESAYRDVEQTNFITVQNASSSVLNMCLELSCLDLINLIKLGTELFQPLKEVGEEDRVGVVEDVEGVLGRRKKTTGT